MHTSVNPQYRFANTIKTSENATLLNYGFMDCGFYTVSEIVPSCRYFCKLNIEIPEANETQEYYVSHGVTDFVVCRDRVLESDYYVLYLRHEKRHNNRNNLSALYRALCTKGSG